MLNQHVHGDARDILLMLEGFLLGLPAAALYYTLRSNRPTDQEEDIRDDHEN